MNRFFLILFCFISASAISQEVVTDLLYNDVVKKAYQDKVQSQLKVAHPAHILAADDTISLPFIDDFSGRDIFPNDSLWTGVDVFVNHTMAFHPPTYGVATFDGVNHRGDPYNFVFASAQGLADSMCSAPIRLDSAAGVAITAASNVYLSFYVQPQGRGNAPETEDSLVLFFKNKYGEWIHVWAMEGRPIGADTNSFTSVFLPVTDTNYFYSGFQFMFRNYATLSGFLDIWNLDFVRLDVNRSATDSIFNDVAFVSMPSSLLNYYHAMPWTHFLADQSNQKKSTLYDNDIINLFNDDKNLHYQYDVIDKHGTILYTQPDLPDNIASQSHQTYPAQLHPAFGFSFPSESGDSTEFMFRNYISSAPDLNRNNDTIYHRQVFYNYYASDDGTVENGYGLNALEGKIAYKFTPSISDSLQGVFMYFTKILVDVGLREFKITIWDGSGPSGKPGNIMFQSELRHPEYQDWLNTFHYYELEHAIYIDKSVTPYIYIGWEQNTADLLNIGLDINNDASDNMFFNTTGVWYKSLIHGAWMMRPAFGNKVRSDINIGVQEPKKATSSSLTVYPNPAANHIQVKISDAFRNESNKQLVLYNLLGAVVLQTKNVCDEIDVSSIPDGLYFLKLERPSHELMDVQKLVISR